MSLQPATNVTAMQPSSSARLIVVSNRLPLTLQKTSRRLDDGEELRRTG